MAGFQDLTGKLDLLRALLEAQKKFQTPKRTHTAKIATRNGGTYEYKYSTLDEIIAATRPALLEHGLICTNNVTMPGSNVIHVTAVLVHCETGQTIESDPWIFQIGSSPQEAGSCSTYGKRYSMSALLGIVAEDDTDGPPQERGQGNRAAQGTKGAAQGAQGTKPRANAKQEQSAAADEAQEPVTNDNFNEPITAAQIERLKRLAKDAGITGKRMKAWLNSMDITESAAIKRHQYQNIVTTVTSGNVPA